MATVSVLSITHLPIAEVTSAKIDFCIAVLLKDGLKVSPFSVHPIGNGQLQEKGLTAETWCSWLARVVALQKEQIFTTSAPLEILENQGLLDAFFRDLYLRSQQREISPPEVWNGTQEFREKLFHWWEEYLEWRREQPLEWRERLAIPLFYLPKFTPQKRLEKGYARKKPLENNQGYQIEKVWSWGILREPLFWEDFLNTNFFSQLKRYLDLRKYSHILNSIDRYRNYFPDTGLRIYPVHYPTLVVYPIPPYSLLVSAFDLSWDQEAIFKQILRGVEDLVEFQKENPNTF